MSGTVYETDASGMITQTVEDADGNQTVIILQVSVARFSAGDGGSLPSLPGQVTAVTCSWYSGVIVCHLLYSFLTITGEFRS